MRIQVNCTSTSESTDRTWIETVFIKYNTDSFHKNPLAYQNRLMSDYFNEHIIDSVRDDIISIRENNEPKDFEEIILLKYSRSTSKEPDQQSNEFDYNFDPHLEDFDTLPTPVRFLKHYYSKIPVSFISEMLEYIMKYKDSECIPAPIAFILGVIHDIGLKVPVNHKLALKYYMESKKGKYPYAFYTIFDIYSRCYKTYDVEKDIELALKQIVKLILYSVYCSDSWLSQTFIGDGAFGYLTIGYSHLDMYEYSCQYAKKILTSSKNPAKRAVMKYLLAIEKKDIEDALKNMEELAKESDDPFLLIKIADVYVGGPGSITKDQDKAKEYLLKLPDSKVESCYKYYGYEMLGYLFDTKGDCDQGFKYLKMASEYGLCYSLKKVGIAYGLGLTVETDLKKSEQKLILAASLGSNDAYLSLFELYIYTKQLKSASWNLLELLLPLVPLFTTFEQDCYQLYKAMILEKGKGVPINYPEAIMIYSTLPKKDFPVALYRLGKVYEKKNNIIQAQQYYEDCYHNYVNILKNWPQPHSSTYIRVAKLYLLGKGCDKNIHRGKEILEKAANMKCCSTIPCLVRKNKAIVMLNKINQITGETITKEVEASKGKGKGGNKEEIKADPSDDNKMIA